MDDGCSKDVNNTDGQNSMKNQKRRYDPNCTFFMFTSSGLLMNQFWTYLI